VRLDVGEPALPGPVGGAAGCVPGSHGRDI
jgi:hypothetical protein